MNENKQAFPYSFKMGTTHTGRPGRELPRAGRPPAGPALSGRTHSAFSPPASLKCHCRGQMAAEPSLGQPPNAQQGLLQRLRDGADHTRCLCGRGRGTEEGARLVPLLVSEVRRDGGALDVQGPGVGHLAVNLHHHLVVLPVDHVLCGEETDAVSTQPCPSPP